MTEDPKPATLPPANWLGRSAVYPRAASVHGLFEEEVALWADAAAVVSAERVVSYIELNAMANRVAIELLALGLTPRSAVGVCMERSPEMIAALLGILKAGGCYLPLDPTYPAERLRMMAEDSGVDLIITTRKNAPQGWSGLAGAAIYFEDLAPGDFENPELEIAATAPAYMMFTSGSTGRPKGVVIPHRGIVRLVRGQDYVSLTAEETILQFGPVGFDASTFEIWGALLNGGRLALAPPGVLGLEQMGESIRALGVTTCLITTGLFHLMVDERVEAFAPLRQVVAGGDVLSVPHARKLLTAYPNLRLVNAYGPTEGTTIATCHVVSTADFERRTMPIGRPIANTKVAILDEARVPVPCAQDGELYIGGDGLAIGYWNRAELTAERFVEVSGQRYYRTGDRARWLEDGLIEFLGRQDHQVKVRGFRIEWTGAWWRRSAMGRTRRLRRTTAGRRSRGRCARGCGRRCRATWCPASSRRWTRCR
jgi:amino acid adenylation domain-containing protein